MGPRILKAVRTPRARRIGITAFIAGWSAGAGRKAKRCVRRAAAVASGVRSTGMPRASRTSAEPEREVTARLPCLATRGTGCGCDEGCGGGDVEGSGEVAAGAAGVDTKRAFGRRQWNGDRAGAEGVDEAGQFVDGFTTRGQRAEQSCNAEVVRGIVENGVQKLSGLDAGEGLAPFQNELERVVQDVRHAEFRVAAAAGFRAGWEIYRNETVYRLLSLRIAAQVRYDCMLPKRTSDEDSRVSGERDSAQVQRAGSGRRDGDDAGAGRHRRQVAVCGGQQGRRGEGADPCGRPRQGRRRQAGTHARRGGCRVEGDPGDAA